MAQGQQNPQTGQPITQTTPLPYNNSQILAESAYQQAVAALKNQKAQTVGTYGFTVGKHGAVNMDAQNTYGQMQQLYHTQGQELTDLGNAQGTAGLTSWYGRSGVANQQRAAALYEQGAQQTDMLKDFQAKMAAIRLGRIAATNQKGKDETSGTLQAIINAITAGSFTPAAPVA